MEARKKICSGCEKESYIWKNHEGGKYCKFCWTSIKYKTDPPKFKPKTPIAPKSKKQRILDDSYLKIRKPFMLKYPMCQVALKGCMNNATDVHHTHAGSDRGKYYLVVSTWLSTCRSCHDWIHNNPKEARKLNLLK